MFNEFSSIRIKKDTLFALNSMKKIKGEGKLETHDDVIKRILVERESV